MAIKLTILDSSGIYVEDAYIKITEFHCYGKRIEAHFKAYVSENFSKQGVPAIGGWCKVFDFIGDFSDGSYNIKKQIYEKIKEEREFSEAIDC